MSNLNYVTYQSFPASTANSIQTISNIKYLIRNGLKVTLYFPLREKESSTHLSELKEYYSVKENFKVEGIKHNLPFGKVNIFNRILFLISHLIWSYSIVNKLVKERPSSDLYLTRSDWVFYFLSKKNSNVTFECHQYTRLRKFLINQSLKKKTSKIIFLNSNLKDDYEDKYSLHNNYIVLHNGVDLEYYSSVKKDIGKEIVFVGKLRRFNASRNISFLLNGIASLDDNYTLKIIGAEKSEKKELIELSKSLGIENRVIILERVRYSDVARYLSSSSIGILINSSSNEHSTSYTSPLKYFEYLAAGLKVLAVDFPSHRSLPFSQYIEFYTEENIQSFVNAVKNIENMKTISKSELSYISLEKRASEINKFINF